MSDLDEMLKAAGIADDAYAAVDPETFRSGFVTLVGRPMRASQRCSTISWAPNSPSHRVRPRPRVTASAQCTIPMTCR